MKLRRNMRKMRTKDKGLLEAINRFDVPGVQQALRNGANVNSYTYVYDKDEYTTPILEACELGYYEIVRIP